MTDGRAAQRLSYEDVMTRLVELARANGSVILAARVEVDDELSKAPDLVRAAARALAGSTNVFADDEPDGRAWFPYSKLTFTDLDGGE